MFKRTLAMAVVFGVAALAPPVMAQNQRCLPRDVLVQTLETKYSETLTGGGLQNAQRRVEIWSSQSGSFTVFVTRPTALPASWPPARAGTIRRIWPPRASPVDPPAFRPGGGAGAADQSLAIRARCRAVKSLRTVTGGRSRISSPATRSGAGRPKKREASVSENPAIRVASIQADT